MSFPARLAAAHRSTAQAGRAACLARPSTDRRTPQPIDRLRPHRAGQRSPRRELPPLIAIARALIAGSIASSHSMSSAESPASRMRGAWRFIQRVQELSVNAAKTAIRHQHNHVAGSMLANDGIDDGRRCPGCDGPACRAPEDRRRVASRRGARTPASVDRNTAARIT